MTTISINIVLILGLLCACVCSKKALRAEETTTTEPTIYLDLEGGGGELFQDCATKINEKGHNELKQINKCLLKSEAPDKVKNKAKNIVKGINDILQEADAIVARRNSKTLFRFRGNHESKINDDNFNRDIEISKKCTAAVLEPHKDMKKMMESMLNCVKMVGSYDNIKDPMPTPSGPKKKKSTKKTSDSSSDSNSS